MGWDGLLCSSTAVPCSTDTGSQVSCGWKGVKVSSELLRLHGGEAFRSFYTGLAGLWLSPGVAQCPQLCAGQQSLLVFGLLII